MFLSPDEIRARRERIRERCEAEGRDPSTLRISVYARDEEMRTAGPGRIKRLAEYAAVGIDRLVAFPSRWDPSVEALERFAEDCRGAGVL